MDTANQVHTIRYQHSFPMDGDHGEEWVDEQGRHHREDGPAITHFYENGTPLREVYYWHGQRHRADGPAVILYDPQGRPLARTYWLWGCEVQPLELPAVLDQVVANISPISF